MEIPWVCVLICLAVLRASTAALSESSPSLLTNSLTDIAVKNPTDNSKQNNQESSPTITQSFAAAVPRPNDYGAIAITIIGVVSGIATILDVLSSRLLPQPTTAEDTLKIVKQVDDLLLPNDEEQYKHAEDTISRALNDLKNELTNNSNIPDIQILLWLERSRWIDTEIVLLMDGLLGKHVTGIDLMKNIKDNLKCNATLITEKVQRYNNLTKDGSTAFNQFAKLGQMSELELLRREAAFKGRSVKVQDRIKEVVEECYQEQLKKNVQDDDDDPEPSTDKIAEKVAQALSLLYPLPNRWIVGVYRDEREQLRQMGLINSRAAMMPIKPKLSAEYNIKNISGYNVALFPFPDGKKPKMINGRFVDVFCNRPIIGAGEKPTCDVGSSDGEYIFDELRRLGIVPVPLDLIVVPSDGQLSIRTVPPDNFPPFLSKHYPDFDIIAF